MADHLSLTLFRRDIPTDVPTQIHTTKRIFLFYLWDMFHNPHLQLSPDSVNVRNWVWSHRKLIFENKVIFHWILANILRYPYNWNHIIEHMQLQYQVQIRVFFHVLAAFFIERLSIRDTIRLEIHESWSDSAKAIIINALTHRLSHSQTIDTIQNIDDADQGLSARIDALNMSPDYINFQRARDLILNQLTNRIPQFEGAPEISENIRSFIPDSSLQYAPGSRQEVENFINGLPCWRDFVP